MIRGWKRADTYHRNLKPNWTGHSAHSLGILGRLVWLSNPTGELHHRRYHFSTNTGGTAPNLSRQRDNNDGRTAGPPRGQGRRSYGFGRRNGLSFFTFVSLVRLILLVAQAEGVGGEGGATEPALGCFTYQRQIGNKPP